MQGFNATGQKVWVMAGEASGDLYGAALAEQLYMRVPGIVIQGMGGPRMREAGVEILVDSEHLGIVGFVEVVRHLPQFMGIMKDLVARAEQGPPDVVVFIDYPGFNLRLAKKLKALGIKIVYYVSPQVWAWGKDRVKTIPQIVDHMMVIFPFEKQFWERTRLPTSFVGHPMVELLRFEDRGETPRQNDLVALLPGSRMSEVSRLIDPLLATAAALYRDKPRYRFVVPVPNERLRDYVQKAVLNLWSRTGTIPIEVIAGDTVRQMRLATAGIAASGTVTVQAAILGLPLVVIYRVNPLTYAMGKRLVKVKYITMVNLVADDQVYEEFIQHDVKPDKLVPALQRILPEGERRAEVLQGMKRAVSLLRGQGNPSEQAARIVAGFLPEPPAEPRANEWNAPLRDDEY